MPFGGVLAALVLGGLLACHAARGPAQAVLALAPLDLAPPSRPASCRAAGPGDLEAELRTLAAGEALCLAPGFYDGPVALGRQVTLWGPRDAVIRSTGEGTTVRLETDGAALLGITVDGSGGRFDLMDAAVRVEGKDIRVEGVRVVGALFGILVEKSSRAVIRRNEIVGNPDQPLGMRGDGIRLWETDDSRIDGNLVRDSRDLVVWYSRGNRFTRNVVERGRYGTHFMYSHGNVVEGSRYRGNVVGIFVMYSRDLEIRGNLLAQSRGAAGVGVGCKESGNLRVVGNAVVGNTVGVYLDTSPLYLEHANLFEGNLFQFSDAAVVLHGSERRNTFTGNDFRSNRATIRIEGRSRGEGVSWRGNFFDEYAGYDLDGDGTGDIAYELRSLESNLIRLHPQLAFFRGSPSLGLVETAGRLIPLFETDLLLIDPTPRMRMHTWVGSRAD